jgi:hypothetical protein
MGVVTEFTLGQHRDITYAAHPAHRNRTPDKSQWTITVRQEVWCFDCSLRNSWLENRMGWGLHLVGGKPKVLGVSADGMTPLAVAFFRDPNRRRYWHGYPADLKRRPSELPPERIRQEWLDKGLLPPAKLRKIMRGQPCIL